MVEEKKSSGSQARNVSQALEQVVWEQCAPGAHEQCLLLEVLKTQVDKALKHLT